MEKRFVVMGLALVLLGASAFAVGFIGTPTAELGQGKWAVGYNYSYSVQDLDKTKVKWSDYLDGVLDDSGVEKLEIKDVKIQRHYFTLSYGIADWWDIYANLGVADTKAQEQWEGDDEEGVNFDNDFAWGWGTKITFAKQDKIDWGATLQMNFIDTSWSDKGVDWTEEINIEAWDLLVAVGPTIDMGGWKLYGGPFYYYLNGEQKGSYREVDDGEVWTGKESCDLKADNNFGGYIGAQFDIAQNWTTNVEFSSTGDGWGLGAGITVKF
jgi:hypothetical protein